MKLIGSYTSPFVRKISVLLLEKGITFEFVNELPYNAENGVAQYNPLGKVPALVTDKGECWFDSPIIAEYIELLDIAPVMIPREPLASLKVRQIEALADGIMDAGLVSVREQARPAAQQSETELLRQREKINRSLDALEGYLVDGTIKTDTVNLATIRHCLRRGLPQFPPRGAGLVCGQTALSQTGGNAVSTRKLCPHGTAKGLMRIMSA
ncbi:putative glutathione S-transferase [Citrobacter koseri]|uniref:Putative glutathione S-transferase n=1 Tax=Citrobacter koseri TaxID=545 RepID=A0A3S4I6I5_CITKO|nr:putative glutathione S-transferase [Citrobacter koseri]